MKRGRPSKIDKETMKSANIFFIVIIVILIILLSVATISIINPEVIDNIKASILNLIK